MKALLALILIGATAIACSPQPADPWQPTTLAQPARSQTAPLPTPGSTEPPLTTPIPIPPPTIAPPTAQPAPEQSATPAQANQPPTQPPPAAETPQDAPSSETDDEQAQPVAEPTPTIDPMELAHTIGDPSAPARVIVFSDFQ